MTGVSCPVVPRTRARRAIGLAVGALYAAVIVYNLCWPTPQGPADQGDFARVMQGFSSGPKDLPLWPSREDPLFRERFFHFYHRFWRLSSENEPAKYSPELAEVLTLPGRWLRFTAPPGHFDLAFNAACIAVLLGAAIAVTAASLDRPILVASLGGAALLLSDLRIAWFLNSFYAESAAYAALIAFLCCAHRLFMTESPRALAAALLCLLLIAIAKFPYAPSALAVAFGLATPLALRRGGAGRRPALVLAGAAIAVTAAWVWLASPELLQKHVAYNFVFGDALPAIPPAERAAFLRSIGIPEEFADDSGRIVYDREARFDEPPLHDALGRRAHTAAVVELARHHTGALLGMLGDAVSESGFYDLSKTGYGTAAHRTEPRTAISITAWSDAREGPLRGAPPYAAATALAALSLLAGLAASGDRLAVWYGATTLGLVCGSLLQIPIAVLGNGRLDLAKHLYLGNVLLDLSLVLGLAGGALALGTLWRRRPAVQSPAVRT